MNDNGNRPPSVMELMMATNLHTCPTWTLGCWLTRLTMKASVFAVVSVQFRREMCWNG